ncbi:MAG: hypothetical protein WKF96_22745 [Solirubrobacteraceae bacterium]
MSQPTAQRTLVKSPPELWAEVSDVESLAKHLGDFGDIRITRIEPETTVVWEGERASGTVELEPSGWGTKVTLTAIAEPEPDAHSEPAAKTPNVADVIPEDHLTDVRVAAEAEPAAPEPLAAAPAPVTANELLAKSGFISRMFKRRKAEIGGPSAPAPDPAPPTPTPVPDAPAPDPEPPLPEPTPLPPREPDPEPPAAAEAVPPLDVAGVLTGVLDTLGAAHHRPFSR